MSSLKLFLPFAGIFLSPSLLFAVQESEADAGGIILHQLEVASKIGSTKKDFDMEESGIVGLGDSAGLSLGLQYYLGLIQQYEEKIEEDKENVYLWLGLAQTWETLKKDANALEAYQQALTISQENSVALRGIQRIKRSRQVQLRVYWSSMSQDEYSPYLGTEYASWKEQVKQVQVTKSWGTGKTIGFGWLDSFIEQDNLLYEDTDYSLHRQAPFFMISWPLADRVSASVRLREEKFSNDDDNAYYQLNENKHIYTGHVLISYRGEGYWGNMNYSRNRETDSIYDLVNARAALYVEVKELAGVSGGFVLAPGLEVGSSIYYEQYGSDSPDQFNGNLQFSHFPSWFPGFQLSLGSGYYTEEKEVIVNLSTNYQWQPWPELLMQLEYQLEYSENEDSWLNQGDLLLSWSFTNQLSMNLRAQYGAETGGDKDTIFFTQASLNWNFF